MEEKGKVVTIETDDEKDLEDLIIVKDEDEGMNGGGHSACAPRDKIACLCPP